VSFSDVVADLSLAPKLWWRYNEASGSAIADASGNGNTGTLHGQAFYREPSITGDGDGAMRFRQQPGAGITTYVQADSYSPFVVGSKRTFVTLLKRQSPQTGIKNIFSGAGNGDLNFPVLETSGGSPDLFRYYGSVNDQFPLYTDWSGPSVDLDEWFLIALGVDDSMSGRAQAKLNVNGRDHGNPNVGLGGPNHWDTTAGKFMVGVRPNGAGGLQTNEGHAATYDETMIFEGLLTNADLVALATAVGIIAEPPGISGVGAMSVAVQRVQRRLQRRRSARKRRRSELTGAGAVSPRAARHSPHSSLSCQPFVAVGDRVPSSATRPRHTGTHRPLGAPETPSGCGSPYSERSRSCSGRG
jgi:hypothetical protein